MKPPRTPRPTPRTLASAPPPSSRAPQATQYQARFPSLMAVLAGGALVPACHAPECGTTRGDELQAHGPESMSAARRGEASRALREIGVALGVVSHDGATGASQAAGAVRPVNVVPPPPPPPELHTAGVQAPVTHEPPETLRPTPPTTPTTHATPRPGARRPVTHTQPAQPPPQPHGPARGDISRVSPLPVAPTLRTTRA